MSNLFQRGVQKIASTAPGAAFFSYLLHHLDKPVYRWSNGRFTLASLFTGLPIILLTTTGAKSGQPRSMPLIGIPHGENIVIIASNWGQHHHPAWYYNLKKNPEVTVMINGRSQTCVARETMGEERETLYQQAIGLYVGYAAYRQRTGGRQIPVVMLTPKTG